MIFFILIIIGLSVGSFLNVLIERLPRGEQVFAGRSHCDSCKHDLGFWDLIPLVSFVALRGKCHYCHSPIPWQNPLVEVVTGAVFVAVAMSLAPGWKETAGFTGSTISVWSTKMGRFPWIAEMVYWWFIASSLIVILFADLRYRIIPDDILFPVGVIVLLRLLIEWQIFGRVPITFFLSAIGAAIFFLALVLITHGRGMGLGDVKFAAFMGLILGFPLVVIALYIAFLTGAIAGIILILLGRKRFGQRIAFGPFLVLGTVLALGIGDQLVSFWSKFFFS